MGRPGFGQPDFHHMPGRPMTQGQEWTWASKLTFFQSSPKEINGLKLAMTVNFSGSTLCKGQLNKTPYVNKNKKQVVYIGSFGQCCILLEESGSLLDLGMILGSQENFSITGWCNQLCLFLVKVVQAELTNALAISSLDYCNKDFVNSPLKSVWNFLT